MEKGMDVDRGILNWFVSSENIYNNNVIMTLFQGYLIKQESDFMSVNVIS